MDRPKALVRGADTQSVQIHALALLAHLSDTNILYRGGTGALAYVQITANDFLAQHHARKKDAEQIGATAER